MAARIFRPRYAYKAASLLNLNNACIVIAFTVANTVDEAIDLANNSEYSLSAALWTSDRFAALNLAPRIRAG